MAKPATRQRMLRQLLVAVLDAPAPTEIRLNDKTLQLSIESASAADAAELVAALHLRNRGEFGQPHPLNKPVEWAGYYSGDLLGWEVCVSFEAPFEGEYVDRWDANGGFERHGTQRPEQVAHA
jgi:hypothetical protein